MLSASIHAVAQTDCEILQWGQLEIPRPVFGGGVAVDAGGRVFGLDALGRSHQLKERTGRPAQARTPALLVEVVGAHDRLVGVVLLPVEPELEPGERDRGAGRVELHLAREVAALPAGHHDLGGVGGHGEVLLGAPIGPPQLHRAEVAGGGLDLQHVLVPLHGRVRGEQRVDGLRVGAGEVDGVGEHVGEGGPAVLVTMPLGVPRKQLQAVQRFPLDPKLTTPVQALGARPHRLA